MFDVLFRREENTISERSEKRTHLPFGVVVDGLSECSRRWTPAAGENFSRVEFRSTIRSLWSLATSFLLLLLLPLVAVDRLFIFPSFLSDSDEKFVHSILFTKQKEENKTLCLSLSLRFSIPQE